MFFFDSLRFVHYVPKPERDTTLGGRICQYLQTGSISLSTAFQQIRDKTKIALVVGLSVGLFLGC